MSAPVVTGSVARQWAADPLTSAIALSAGVGVLGLSAALNHPPPVTAVIFLAALIAAVAQSGST
ncbi:hypothetical protein [Janibacter sp. GXQ6167]|uniref:hypothetical protein n=1 Tax=Janibacter sp. GXQ6167 TaxID=3240791 RepID=UPI0035255887